MSMVVSRIIGGLAMMILSIILLITTIVLGIIEVIVRVVAVVIMVLAMFVAGIATIFGMDKLVDLCEDIIDKVTNYVGDK